MAKYIYQTATGPVEINVNTYWGELLRLEDALEELNDRRHRRPDHKYAPCAPLSIESLNYEGSWFEKDDDHIAAAELLIDLLRVLTGLTELQRRYFIMARIEGHSFVDIGKHEGKAPSTIQRIVAAAEESIRKFF